MRRSASNLHDRGSGLRLDQVLAIGRLCFLLACSPAGVAAKLVAAFLGLALIGACVSLTGADPSKRTLGTVIDDEAVERLAKRHIRDADDRLAESHINVVSYHGVVLLTGEVETAVLRDRAERAVANIRKIRTVHNDIQVGGPSNLVARANDSWIATKVRSGLTASEEVKVTRIKVVAERGVIYLIGVVPRDQGDAAAEIARDVFGVNRVVKVFDYLD